MQHFRPAQLGEYIDWLTANARQIYSDLGAYTGSGAVRRQHHGLFDTEVI
jgi:hypothetical protein